MTIELDDAELRRLEKLKLRNCQLRRSLKGFVSDLLSEQIAKIQEGEPIALAALADTDKFRLDIGE